MQALRYLMQFNALSCAAFGALLLVFGGPIGTWLGGLPSLVATLAGVVLLFNSAHLVIAAGRLELSPLEVRYFVLGDTAWVLLTVVLIGLGLIGTGPGIRTAAAVAVMVGGFALGQALLLRKSRLKPEWHLVSRK